MTVLTREAHRRVYAHDASHYVIYPEEVRIASTVEDVAVALRDASRRGTSVTFRSGGTSLSGQSLGPGILIDTRQGFRSLKVRDGGGLIEAGPGVTVRHANRVLARRGRILGPDPASEIAATLGGVVSNNSSGMVCGTEHNSYNLIDSFVFTLASGTTIDSARADADETLAEREPALYAELGAIRDEIAASDEMTGVIARQFAMKNTMGYAMNAFLDYTRPIDILTHLLVGSEGTPAFISKIRMKTVPTFPLIADALIVFETLADAAETIADLEAAGAHAIELMDATSLRVAQTVAGTPPEITGLSVAEHCALLVECRAASEEDLASRIEAVRGALASHGIEPEMITDPERRASLWSVRKGLYAACAGHRPPGTTALLEDVVVPVSQIAETATELARLCEDSGYTDSVIFGHAKDGNLHFMITDNFTTEEGRARLESFTEELVDLILSAGGNLKAEHGTGRAMAPFVERQYGRDLYDLMWRLKRAADPRSILGPGVILTTEDAYLDNMKTVPGVDPIVDRCVECGYCENVCPSADLTLTPRTRIALTREIDLARAADRTDLVRDLEDVYDYQVLHTCAVDGMCSTACPLGINTGDLVRQERARKNPAPWRALWTGAAKAWGPATKVLSGALTAASKVPAGPLKAVTSVGRALLSTDRIPAWSESLPAGGSTRARPAPATYEAIYFPSCLGSLFEASGGTLVDDVMELCEKAGVSLLIPDGIDSLCCGTPWSSKGMTSGYEAMVTAVRRALGTVATDSIPVVCDASSCTEGLVKALAEDGFTVLDAPTFLARHVVDKLTIPAPVDEPLTIHPTCSTTHLGSTPDVLALARLISTDVRVPDSWGCCGYAGDRGLLHPELTASATRAEAMEVTRLGRHASSNRTCEMGMSAATGLTYDAIVSLLADHVRKDSRAVL